MIRFHAEGEREGPILGAPASMQAKPEELMDDLKSGKLRSIQFSANVFVTGPNRNHFVIPDTELESFAKSFEGLPFLRDHEENLSAVGGRIVSSKVVDREDGRKAIHQTILANKPWAMENVLDGTVNRFSIGWFAKRQVCTSCNVDFLSKECKHMPWDVGKTDPKGNTVEIRTEGCEGREVSAVVTPAVPDTGIEALMRAKEEVIKASGNSVGNSAEQLAEAPKEADMFPTVLAALGLAEKAEEAEVLAKIEQLKAPTPLPVALMTALGLKPEASADEAIAVVVKMTAPDAFIPRAQHDKVVAEYTDLKAEVHVNELIAKGKIMPANREWALKQAKTNPAGFAVAYPESAPRVTPLGVEPPALLKKDEEAKTLEASEIAKKLGVTDEEYAAEVAADRKRLSMEGR